MPDSESLIPEITDEDIEWVQLLLGLDPFDRSRRDFLKRLSTVDLSACPGSGKTTLIVAKLAILAKKWPHRIKGICVLSHTNAARQQIEHRLGRTVVGQKLLAYPHFIDTIHGFANRFLALPWLYSNGYPPPTIDDELTTAQRRRILGEKGYRSVQVFLNKKHTDFDKLRICGRDLSFDLGGKQFPAKPSAQSFQHAKRAIESAAQDGYFCYDEMFVWARALLEDHTKLPDWLALRFPLVILDEMQDTFERQKSMLSVVFPRNSNKIAIQRIGDPNQEIFDLPDAKSGTGDTYPDPEPAQCLSIPNSYRFGNEIAGLASPFAVHPVETDGLSGIGPKEPAAAQERQHTIFVFPDNSTKGLLEAFAQHALEVLGDSLVTQGTVHAVGHIHQDDPEVVPGHAHYPKSIGHYWNGYVIEISRADANPRTLAQYVRVAQGLLSGGWTLSPAVDKIASGTIELARRIGEIGDLKRKTRKHRAVLDALVGNADSLAGYRGLLMRFLVERSAPCKRWWPSHAKDFTAVAAALCNGRTNTRKAASFLIWPEDAVSLDTNAAGRSSDLSPNTFRYNSGRETIDIRLGSIHSVKGQTHLATLLLNTYWYAHSAKEMMPWLLGEKSNGKGTGSRNTQRLRHTYVAMTRPSHLLCLAVPRSALGSNSTLDKNIATLKGRGWRVAEIADGAARWRD